MDLRKMSYFSGPVDTSEYVKRKNPNKHKQSPPNKEIKPVHKIVHKKKHSLSRHVYPKNKLKTYESHSRHSTVNNEQLKDNDKCDQAEMAQCIDKNNAPHVKLKKSHSNSESSESQSKFEKKYKKLKQNYEKLLTNEDKMKSLLVEQENKFQQVFKQHENLIIIVNKLEQERIIQSTTINNYEKRNQEQSEDISLLKNLIYFLNAEIENYQSKLQASNQVHESESVYDIINKNEMNVEYKDISKKWEKIDFNIIGPLLNAYQESINEKDKLIHMYKGELDDFTNKIRTVIAENDNLHVDIQKLKNKNDTYINEIELLRKDNVFVKDEKKIMFNQLEHQKQKIHEIYKICEQKTKSMSHENTKLQTEYVACKTDLNSLRREFDILSSNYEKLKSNSVKMFNDEIKTSINELKLQNETEMKKINCQLKSLEEKQLEKEEQLETDVEKQNQSKSQRDNLKKVLKQTQFQLTYVKSSIASIKIFCDSLKKLLPTITLYYVQSVEEQEKFKIFKNQLLNSFKESEKEKNCIEYSGQNVICEVNQTNLNSTTKIDKNKKLDIDQLKSEYQREFQRLKQLLQQKEKAISKLYSEKYIIQENYELLWKIFTEKN